MNDLTLMIDYGNAPIQYTLDGVTHTSKYETADARGYVNRGVADTLENAAMMLIGFERAHTREVIGEQGELRIYRGGRPIAGAGQGGADGRWSWHSIATKGRRMPAKGKTDAFKKARTSV